MKRATTSEVARVHPLLRPACRCGPGSAGDLALDHAAFAVPCTGPGTPRFESARAAVKQSIVFLARRRLLPPLVAYWLIQSRRLRDA